MATTEEILRKALGDMLHIGVNARDDATILMNFRNLIRRNECLGAVEREFFVSLDDEAAEDVVNGHSLDDKPMHSESDRVSQQSCCTSQKSRSK